MVNPSKIFVSQSAKEAFFKEELPRAGLETNQLAQSGRRKLSNRCAYPGMSGAEDNYHLMFDQYQNKSIDHTSKMSHSLKTDVAKRQHYPYPIQESRTTTTTNLNPNADESFKQQLPHFIQRQYSINTVIDVIENHKIEDDSSSSIKELFWRKKMEVNNSYPTQTLHSNENHTVATMPMLENYKSTAWKQPSQDPTRSVPPVSDVLEYNQYDCSPAYSSFSTSPGPVPFERYQDEQQLAKSPTENCAFNPAAICLPESNRSNVCADDVIFSNEDITSPILKADIQWDWAYEPDQTNIFLSDETPIQGSSFPSFGYPDNVLKHSHSLGQFSTEGSTLSPADPIEAKHGCLEADVTFTTKDSRMRSTSSSLMCAVGMNSLHIAEFPLVAQLEEINNPIIAEKVQEAIGQHEQIDLRRKRNNRACRASRQRRKERRIATEQQVERLQGVNNELKAKIIGLQKEHEEVLELVQRRMNEIEEGNLRGFESAKAK